MSLDEAVKSLQEDVVHLKAELYTLSKNQSSRRGTEGPRGLTGSVGPAGRDAVLIVKTDASENIVRVYDESGSEKATLIPLPGKDGRDCASIPGKDGVPGRDGKDAPSLQEIVRTVLVEVKAHWARL